VESFMTGLNDSNLGPTRKVSYDCPMSMIDGSSV
jgi:hypothetical protein